MARPTEYKEEFILAVDSYLNNSQDSQTPMGKGRYTSLQTKVRLPTIEDFASYIGVSKRVLYEWEKRYPEFMHALDKIRAEQQKRLINEGLSGNYNSTIAKLILSSNHGMREKTDVTTNDKDLITSEAIDKANTALKAYLDVKTSADPR